MTIITRKHVEAFILEWRNRLSDASNSRRKVFSLKPTTPLSDAYYATLLGEDLLLSGKLALIVQLARLELSYDNINFSLEELEKATESELIRFKGVITVVDLSLFLIKYVFNSSRSVDVLRLLSYEEKERIKRNIVFTNCYSVFICRPITDSAIFS
jgi:hypothetical protein